MKNYLLLIIFLFSSQTSYGALSIQTVHRDNQTIEINATIVLEANDFLYKDYLDFSVDHPGVILSQWKSSIEPVNHYDTKFKNNKKIFTKTVTFTLTAYRNTPIDTSSAHLHISYYPHLKKRIIQKIMPLLFDKPSDDHLSKSPDQTPSLINPKKKPLLIPEAPISPFNKDWAIVSSHAATIINWPYFKVISIIIMILIGLFLIAIKADFNPLKRFKSKIWVFELRQLYGITLLALFLYKIRPITPRHLLFYSIALLNAIIGIFYIYQSERITSPGWRQIRTIVGVLFLASSFVVAFYGYKATHIDSYQKINI